MLVLFHLVQHTKSRTRQNRTFIGYSRESGESHICVWRCSPPSSAVHNTITTCSTLSNYVAPQLLIFTFPHLPDSHVQQLTSTERIKRQRKWSFRYCTCKFHWTIWHNVNKVLWVRTQRNVVNVLHLWTSSQRWGCLGVCCLLLASKSEDIFGMWVRFGFSILRPVYWVKTGLGFGLSEDGQGSGRKLCNV